MPKVSVIIPNYNHARFLEKRIQSVLNQTYQDFEVIYLDDASTDNSNQVFEKFAGDKRIQAVYNKTNSGSPFKQWNLGIRLAKGDYVWIAESDDYADERFLGELVDRLDNNPAIGLAYCQSWIVNDYDNTMYTCKLEWTGSLDKKRWRKDFINIGKDECARSLIFGNTIPNASAVLLRRSIYEKAGYVDENMRICGDWMLWVKMLLISNVAFVDKPFNYFCVHLGTVRKKTYKNGIYIEESYQVIRYILGKLRVPRKVVEQVCEAMVYKWVNIVFSEKGEIPCHRQYRIYKLASDVDSQLKLRLIKTTLLHWRWQVRQVALVRIIVRYIKHVLREAHTATGFLSPGD